MQMRYGVSLIEVLVAMVLLGVGIAGTLSTLAAAARLREQARNQEALASEALDRLAWFEARACAQLDTADRTIVARAELDWGVTDSAGRRILRFDAVTTGHRAQRLSLRSSWQCA